jgi:BirA family transcriptional regulator, biotin operon repressor / biotin---[acetyl-CoA-carboxylase] ligase
LKSNQSRFHVPATPQPVPPELASAIAERLDRLHPFGKAILYFETIGSTNDVATAVAAGGGGHGAVVIADAQTAGRGRRGRRWFSPPGAGLYVSVVVTPGLARTAPERATALLTLSAGVALCEAVEQVTGLAPAIKWPNDLLIGRRKLAGILAEGVASSSTEGLQAVILGYGINVRSVAYPAGLASIVTSLEGELGREVDRAALCAESLAAIGSRYRDLLEGRFDVILDAWRSRAFGGRGAKVEWDTPAGVRSGITEGIDHMGALLVRSGHVLERIVAGEVRWGLHAARD